MAESRKRGRREAGSPALTPEVLPPAAPLPVPAAGEWRSREETMRFPADPPPPPASRKLELPSSGLASDILGLAEAAAVDQGPLLGSRAPAPGSEPASDTPRSHAVSFFAPAREERKEAEATEHLATF